MSMHGEGMSISSLLVMITLGLDLYIGDPMWTCIFHMRPHSISETHFLFVKN